MNKKILLIDDSVTIHRVIDLCVDKEKYDVVKVFNKDEAASALKTGAPDLVLLDNKLADIKTIDIVQMVKEANPSCYVILLAGAFDQFDRDQCDETGADDFIYKPFDAKTLDAKIACGLEGLCEDAHVREEPGVVSDEDMLSIMPDSEDDEVEIPDFDDAAALIPADEALGTEDAVEQEIKSVKDFDGLKEIDEEELLAQEEEQEEPVSAPVTEETDVIENTPEIEDIAAQTEVELPAEVGNPFDGLVETEEQLEEDKEETEPEPAAQHNEAAVQPDAEEEFPSDELDSILNDINEDEETVDLSAMDDAENAISSSEKRIDAENAFDMDEEIRLDEPDTDESEMPYDVEADAIDMPELALDEPAEDELGINESAAEETEPEKTESEEPEMESFSADEPEAALPEDEMMINKAIQEDEKEDEQQTRPPVYISEEKLVEAVYEAIDEDTLKFAIKEVLTDKITRILEDELPYLVEKAIRKEIERLVKGS